MNTKTKTKTKTPFKPGDRVRRVNYDNNDTVRVGTEWTVARTEDFYGSAWLTFKETDASGGDEDNFVLVSSAEPKPPIKATLYIPVKEIEELVAGLIEAKLGIKTNGAGIVVLSGRHEVAVEAGIAPA